MTSRTGSNTSHMPSTGVWRSAQNGPTFGEIAGTRNIDLSKDGRVSLARKAMAILSYGLDSSAPNGEDPAFQGTLLAVISDASYIYALSGASAFVIQNDNQASALQVPSLNKPTYGFDSDMAFFQTKPHVSGGEYVCALNPGLGGVYTRVITGLSTDAPHPLCVIEQLDQLAVGNGKQVIAYDTSYSAQYTLTLPSEYVVTTMRWRQNNLYIGTRHIYGGEAKLFIWNGSGTAAQYGYGVGADWVYSLCEYQSSIVIVTSAGQIRRFNGGGFDALANFPIYDMPLSWASSNPNSYLVGKVANRGMAADGDNLYLTIDGTVTNAPGVYPGSYLPAQPSGLWQYTSNSGLFHKAGINFGSRIRFVPSSLDSGFITSPAPHQLETGDPVLAAPDGITGLNSGQVYYAMPGSETTFQLALSPADALNGRAIALSGAPTDDFFVVDRYETLGDGVISYPGGTFVCGRTRLSSFFADNVLFGGGIYDTSLTLYRAALCSLSVARNRGYFVTSRIPSERLNDVFGKIAAFVERLNLDTDQIVVKFRVKPRFGVPSPLAFSGDGANWTSSTTFTVDPTQKDVKSIQVGDEIEIVSGSGAGYLAHITAIDDSSLPYAYTIDEEMPVSSGTFDFIADNWTKQSVYTRDTLIEMKTGFQGSFAEVQGNYLELKIELRGQTPIIDSLDVIQSVKQ